MTEQNLLAPQVVCQTCLLADPQGLPRWQQNRLCCGSLIQDLGIPPIQQPGAQLDSVFQSQNVRQFRCQMGFRLASVDLEDSI